MVCSIYIIEMIKQNKSSCDLIKLPLCQQGTTGKYKHLKKIKIKITPKNQPMLKMYFEKSFLIYFIAYILTNRSF